MTPRRISPRLLSKLAPLFLAIVPSAVACSSDDPADDGGKAGTGGGSAASGGSAGTAGTSSAGKGGSAGSSAGATGKAGAGGSTAGSAGSGSPAGAGGSSGSATSGGAAGASGGGGSAQGGAGSGGIGTAGGGASSGGAAGASGSAGAGGASSGGAAGQGGAAAGAAGSSGAGGSGGAGAFSVTTPAFVSQMGCSADAPTMCALFPRDNTNYGDNVSPELTWTGAPTGTLSYVVLLQDLTNSNAHWVLWNIPASVTTLAANVPTQAMPSTPAGSQQASIGTGDGYFGPGACGNVYEFVVFALGVATFSPTMATNQTNVRTQLLALDEDILAQASIRAHTGAPNCP